MNHALEISEIRVFTTKTPDSKLKGFANVVLNNCLKISGLKIIQGEHGLFVGFPAEKGKDGKYYDIVRPINRFGIDLIQDSVLSEFEKCAAHA